MRALATISISLVLALTLWAHNIDGNNNLTNTTVPQTNNQPRLATQTGHKGAITSSAFSPDGRLVLTGSEDGTAILWDKFTGFALRRFDPQWKYKVYQLGIGLVRFSPDGSHIILAESPDGNHAGIWNTATGEWKNLAVFLPSESSITDTRETVGMTPGYELAPGADGDIVVAKKKEHMLPDTQFAFSPDGQYLVGNVHKSLVLVSALTGDPIHRFTEVSGNPSCFTFSPDSKSILVGTIEKKAYLLNVSSKRLIGTFGEYSDEITSVSFSPDGKLILIATKDKLAYLLDMATGAKLQQFVIQSKEDKDDIFSSNSNVKLIGPNKGIALFSPDSRFIITESQDDEKNAYMQPVYHRAIHIWRKSGERVEWFEGKNYKVVNIAFVPNQGRLFAFCTDGNVRIWDTVAEKEIREISNVGVKKTRIETALRNDKTIERQTEGVSDPLVRFELSPDLRFLLTLNYDGEAKLWDIASGREITWFKKGDELLTSIDFSPDGTEIMVGNDEGIARLYDVARTQEKSKFEPHFFNVTSVAMSSNANFILTGGEDKTAHLWDVTSGKEIRRFEGHTEAILSVALSPNMDRAITAGVDKKAFIWDTKTGQKIYSLEINGTVHSTLFSPNGSIAVTLSDEDVQIWDVSSGRALHGVDFPVRGGYLAATAAAFSPDGSLLFIAWDQGVGSLFSVGKTGKLEIISRYRMKDATNSVMDSTHLTLSMDFSYLSSVIFSSDGKYIFGGFNYGGQPIIFDPRNGNVEKRFRTLSSGFGSAYFSSLNNDIMVGIVDGEGVIWSAKSGTEIKRFGNNTAYMNQIEFSKDGKLAVTAHVDGTTRLWNTLTWQEICSLVSFSDGDWVVINPEGRFDTSSLEDVRGLRWIMPDDPFTALPVEVFMRPYYEPRLLPRLLINDHFKNVPSLADLNRVQPKVTITNVRKDGPKTAAVTIEVENVERRFKRENNPIVESDAKDLRLFRDGQLVSYKDGNILEQQQNPTSKCQIIQGNSTKCKVVLEHIMLPQQKDTKAVEFSAYAFNASNVKSETSRYPFLFTPDPPVRKGNVYLITIGVSKYENPLWDLEFAANDAHLVSDIVSASLRATKEYDDVVDVVLTSEEKVANGRKVLEKSATKENFRRVLRLLAGENFDPEKLKGIPNAYKIQKATPDDVVLIFYSSHGYRDTERFYLFPYDTGVSEGRDPEAVVPFAISSDDMYQWLRDIDAGDLVLIVDACHAAAAIQNKDFKPGPMGSRGMGQLAYDKGMRILAATQPDTTAVEVNYIVQGRKIQHGLLTYALIEDGLIGRKADNNSDKIVLMPEWLKYGVEDVPKLYEEVLKCLSNRQCEETSKGEGAKVRFVSKGEGDNTSQQPALFDFTEKVRRQRQIPIDRF